MTAAILLRDRWSCVHVLARPFFIGKPGLGAIKRLNLAFLVDAKLENAFWAGSYKARFPRNSGERLGETREQRTNVLALVKRGDNDSKLYGAEAWTLRVAGGGSSGAKSGSGLALSHFVAGLTALLSARRR